jgi:uncharacterized protein (DUF58 family)
MKLREQLRYSPTSKLALAVAVLAPIWLLSGFPAGQLLALAVTFAIAVAAALDTVLLPAAKQLRVERHLPGAAGLGDAEQGSYEIHSEWPRPLFLTLHHDIPTAVGPGQRDFPSLRIGFSASSKVEFTFVPTERGNHNLGAVVLRVTGPLGLVRRSLRFDVGGTMVIAPSLAGIRRYRLLALQHRLRDAGVRAIRRRGQGTSFAALREYVRGDDPRYIDWKASARRRTLISREYSVEQGQTVFIVLDAGRMMTQLSGTQSRFEYALSSALVLADVAQHSRDQVGLLIFDDEVRVYVPPSRGTASLARIRSALIAAQARLVEPDYAMAFRTIAARHRKRSLIVLFSDVIDARSSQAVIAHTIRSASRHLPLVVALRNDRLMESSLPHADGKSGSLYASAAAEELVSARAEALAGMRRSGVSVLDVSPQVMSPAVLSRYLELKGRASI